VKLGWHAAFQIVAHWKPSFALLSSLCNTLVRVTMAVGVTVATLLTSGTPFAEAQTPAPGKRSDIIRTLPITKFYDTPDPLPTGKPGELIRSEEFDQYELPFSVSAVRILYHSRSAAGEDVAASGVILIPAEGKPPARGWPVIAWAHGATGVARPCAPSLMRNVGHGPFLSMYVNLGYAVVATDYAGLGTNCRNAFLDGPSNATDLIASVTAARAAVTELGARWIVMGEAEGSLVALAVAEKETEIRDPSYLGSITISGVLSAEEIYVHSAQGSSSLMLTSLAYGIKTVYPQFQETDMLTEKGLALYHRTEQMCSEARTIPELSAAEVVKPGWEKNAFVRQYFVRNDLDQKPAYGPLLVISGDGDQATPPAGTAQAIARMCTQGDRVQWERYHDLDPERVIGDSVRDQIAWIEARFAGRTPATNCP
jgi:alpha-beta hydrolase superfamily lysophospholipase